MGTHLHLLQFHNNHNKHKIIPNLHNTFYTTRFESSEKFPRILRLFNKYPQSILS
jgi:hypothetical protein